MERAALDAARQAKGTKIGIDIHSIDPTKDLLCNEPESNLESLLDRFSSSKKEPRTVAEKIARVVADFFAKIRETFQFIDRIWEAITHSGAKQLKWDLAVLSEVCGSPAPQKMTLHQALRYMDEMLGREREELSDLQIRTRVRQALFFSEGMESLRDSFSEKKFKRLVEEIQRSVSSSETILVPVGFSEENERNEMLLEIRKETNGTCSIALISASQEALDLFDHEQGIEIGGRSIRREITSISEADLLGAIPILVELQTGPECLKANTRETFLQALKFEGSSVAVSEMTERVKSKMAPGRLGEIVAYLRGEKGDDGKGFELALRLRAFLDLCKENKRGMRDFSFWTHARTTGLHLARLIEEEKDRLGADEEQGVELTRIYHEIQDVLDALERSPPHLADLRGQLTPKERLLFTISLR
jgi:hypothetical protein